MYKHFFKRFFDFWIALVALICISPILIVVTIGCISPIKGQVLSSSKNVLVRMARSLKSLSLRL